MATAQPGLAAEAMRRLLRGANWHALAHEIAWNAAKRAGAGHEVLEWLPDLVEARLAARVDLLEFRLEQALGEDAATQDLERVYSHVLDWATDLLAERSGARRRRRRSTTKEGAGGNRPPRDRSAAS